MAYDDEDIIDEMFEMDMLEEDEKRSGPSRGCCLMTLMTLPVELLLNLFR